MSYSQEALPHCKVCVRDVKWGEMRIFEKPEILSFERFSKGAGLREWRARPALQSAKLFSYGGLSQCDQCKCRGEGLSSVLC